MTFYKLCSDIDVIKFSSSQTFWSFQNINLRVFLSIYSERQEGRNYWYILYLFVEHLFVFNYKLLCLYLEFSHINCVGCSVVDGNAYLKKIVT